MPKQRSTRTATPKSISHRDPASARKEQQSSDEISCQLATFAAYAQTAKQLVLDAWPDIIQGLIKKAIGGGYQQTKILLDLCHLATTDESLFNEKEKQDLCDALLHGLGLFNTRGKAMQERACIGNHEINKTADK